MDKSNLYVIYCINPYIYELNHVKHVTHLLFLAAFYALVNITFVTVLL